MDFLVAMAIPVIGNGRPKLDFITASACELKSGGVSCSKRTGEFFSSEIRRTVFQERNI